jgi:hypothetical protein
LKRLGATEQKLSGLDRTMELDADFFRPEFIRLQKHLATLATETLTTVAEISDGNHFTISGEFAETGVPYYRGQDVVGNFFIEQSASNFITENAFHNKHMLRSHLKGGDVLLSIVGTIGETSLVQTSTPATCSCKLAILRPRSISPAYLASYLSSKVGRSLTKRWKRGAVQMGLLLEDMDQIDIPRWVGGLEAMLSIPGELYWMRAHQLPGVLVCHIHQGVPLANSMVHPAEANRHEYIAADETNCPQTPPYPAWTRNPSAIKLLRDIATASTTLMTNPPHAPRLHCQLQKRVESRQSLAGKIQLTGSETSTYGAFA